MGNKMLIDATHPEETRVVVLRGNRVEEFDYESASRKQLRGNIYLAKVTRVEPSLQAAFVNYGGNRHGFLAFNEIHPDYYQLPMAERHRSGNRVLQAFGACAHNGNVRSATGAAVNAARLSSQGLARTNHGRPWDRHRDVRIGHSETFMMFRKSRNGCRQSGIPKFLRISAGSRIQRSAS